MNMRKWKPNKTQRREFAEKMKDPEFARAYYERKEKRAEKRRANSQFDYESAGGYYIPTKAQFDAATELSLSKCTIEQKTACNEVIFGYLNKEKVHHDFIHIVNEYIRSSSRSNENNLSL